jgi:hypothetical protein
MKKTKASERGGVLGPGGIIDIGALSERARRKPVRGAAGVFTQNSTVKTSLGPLGFAGILEAAYLSTVTAPAGGALGVKIVAYDASANAEIVLTDVSDPEGLTSREGAAMVLAATNVALEPEDSIEIHTIADNNAVGTAQVGMVVSMMFKPTEETTIDM